MNLLSMLMSSMTSNSSVDSLSKKTGISGVSALTILSYALPLLTKAMTSNASSQAGAQSLLSALTQHSTNKSIADQISTADQKDGEKIIGHILGDNTNATVEKIAKESGASIADVSTILSAIAPSLLSSLSAATTQAQPQTQTAGFDFTSLASSLLGGGTAGGMNDIMSAFMKTDANANANTNGTDLLTALLGLKK